MKVKLLKEIRRRFKIYHYPTGTKLPLWNRITEKDVWLLFDNRNEYYVHSSDSYDEAIVELRRIIRNTWEDYSIKFKKQQNKIKKVWYNG
jgi:hypothetical protein